MWFQKEMTFLFASQGKKNSQILLDLPIANRKILKFYVKFYRNIYNPHNWRMRKQMQIEKKRNENVQFKYPDLLQETNDAHVDKIKMVRNIGGKKIT